MDLPTGTGPWRASVDAIGNPRDGRQVATVAIGGGAREPLSVAITAPPDPALTIGDLVILTGRLQPVPEGPYGAWLRQSGVGAVLEARALEIAGRSGSPTAAVDRLRRAAADGLARVLPEPAAGLAAGILIGLRDRVDRDLAASFTTAGVSHIVAISGWNIAIVAALVTALAPAMAPPATQCR